MEKSRSGSRNLTLIRNDWFLLFNKHSHESVFFLKNNYLSSYLLQLIFHCSTKQIWKKNFSFSLFWTFEFMLLFPSY